MGINVSLVVASTLGNRMKKVKVEGNRQGWALTFLLLWPPHCETEWGKCEGGGEEAGMGVNVYVVVASILGN
jgi:hypothetical protein